MTWHEMSGSVSMLEVLPQPMLDYVHLKRIKRIVQRKAPNLPVKVLREAIILWLLKTNRNLHKMEDAAVQLKPERFVAVAKRETFL